MGEKTSTYNIYIYMISFPPSVSDLVSIQLPGKMPECILSTPIAFIKAIVKNSWAPGTYNSFPHFAITHLLDVPTTISEKCAGFIIFFVLLLITTSWCCHQKRELGAMQICVLSLFPLIFGSRTCMISYPILGESWGCLQVKYCWCHFSHVSNVQILSSHGNSW